MEVDGNAKVDDLYTIRLESNRAVGRYQSDRSRNQTVEEYSYPKTVHFQSFGPFNPSGPSALTLDDQGLIKA